MAKKEIVCPFSGFEGQLLFKGEPAAGAKITRRYELFKEKGEETVIVDDQGRFAFESIFIPFRTPFLSPVEFLSYQDIIVEFNSNKIQVWESGKMIKNEFSEFGGRPKNLLCELTEEIRRVEVDREVIGTSCHWEL